MAKADWSDPARRQFWRLVDDYITQEQRRHGRTGRSIVSVATLAEHLRWDPSALSRRLSNQVKARPPEHAIGQIAAFLHLSEREQHRLLELAGYRDEAPGDSPVPVAVEVSRLGEAGQIDMLSPTATAESAGVLGLAGGSSTQNVRLGPRWNWLAGWTRRVLSASGAIAGVLIAGIAVIGGVLARPGVVLPGGVWIAPQSEQYVSRPIHFVARAYPSERAAPAIASVAFTLTWEGRPGPWLEACRVTSPTHTDLYECDFDPMTVDVPSGLLQVSFDVYDQLGSLKKAPHGVRSVTYQP